MALISVIRRWRFRDQLPIREITRRTGLSRNTVKKYLASTDAEPSSGRRKVPSKLDDYEQTLTTWLHREAKRHRKQRKNIKQLFHDLVDLGYSGSYDRVAAFARQWREQLQIAQQTSDRQCYVPLRFALGEAFQFDWSEDWVRIAGSSVRLQLAHTKLCYSRAFLVRGYWQQSHEMLFDAHEHAFRVFEGIPERGIYDNMKTAVDKVGRGKQRTVNKRFHAMTGHYLFEAEFCNPASGWEKGQVEKAVQDARGRLWQGAPAFASMEELNAWLEDRCRQLWRELAHPEQPQRRIADCWEEEKARLMPVPAPFDGFVEYSKRVSSVCLITFERNRYSVPASFANRVVSLRVYADRLLIVAEAQVVARHRRVFCRDHGTPGQTVYDWRHYLAVLQRKPGALRNGAPFQELPESFRVLQAKLLKHPGGDREMVDILALVLLHDEHLVEQAVAAALAIEQPSKQHVLNCLGRLQDVPRPAPSGTPPALRLMAEPQADTARYDRLREAANDR